MTYCLGQIHFHWLPAILWVCVEHMSPPAMGNRCLWPKKKKGKLELFITCLAVSPDTQWYMGHMNDQGTEFNNDLSLVWSWCTEGINPGSVATCQWTGFSLNQYFASGFLNSFMDILFPKLLLEVFMVLLPYCTTAPGWMQWENRKNQ